MKTVIEGQTIPESLTLNISSAIVYSSQQCNFNRCMIAEAVAQKHPSATHIYVDMQRISFTLRGVRRTYLPTPWMASFIADFDAGKQVKPFRETVRLAKAVCSGFASSHPKGDNRTNACKKYKQSEKKRNYPSKVRVNGLCIFNYKGN